MKILFTVQGEGRGHMTQAIAAHEMLARHNHEVTAVLAGGNPSRNLPSFFENAFGLPVRRISSPGFVQARNRGISLLHSGAQVIRNFSQYRNSLREIDAAISETSPDLVVNFLEPLLGVYNLLRAPSVPTLAVGHQFMIEHPSYLEVDEFPLQRMGMKNFVRITGARSTKLALSFYAAEDLPGKNIIVSPPILRRQLFALQPTDGSRLLVYLVFHGFSEDIAAWSREHPEIPVDCFYDKPNAPFEERVSDSLTFHRLDGEKFLRMMAECRAVTCTAGFESVSEAAYLGKPILMVPVENHLEQFLNGWDAENAGLGIRDSGFALSRLTEESCVPADESFKAWVDRSEEIFLNAVEEAVEANAVDDDLLREAAGGCVI